VNHNLFWKLLTPNYKDPSDKVTKLLEKHFSSQSNFTSKFTEAATKVFGSGWVWLLADNFNNLQIQSFPNQDNTYMVNGLKSKPILGIDVWEHAYYLRYQNKRAKYIEVCCND
jgi:Fe-Mn family superoxide dismutase